MSTDFENINGPITAIAAMILSRIANYEEKKAAWRFVKKELEPEFRRLLAIPDEWGIKSYELFDFDIDEENSLILLNYTKQAHAVLHSIEGGWTEVVRLIRGLVFKFDRHERTERAACGETLHRDDSIGDVRLVSRGFEKFFNYDEISEVKWDMLDDELHPVWSKEDGAMVEYFVHNGELRCTTRGRLQTQYSDIGLELLTKRQFESMNAKRRILNMPPVMNIICELIAPESRVHVDYGNEKKLFLLAAYDDNCEKLDIASLEWIARELKVSTPPMFMMNKSAVRDLITDRQFKNKEGFVIDFGNRLVKFKFIDYLNLMVQTKLSYKYIMSCDMGGRLERMLPLLDGEIQPLAWQMVEDLRQCVDNSEDHWSLYSLWKPDSPEGGESYFRTIARKYFKHRKGIMSEKLAAAATQH